MSVMRVRHGGAVQEFDGTESIGFGRTRSSADDPLGWGFSGRFIEVGPSMEIHRVWGALVPASSGWHVVSMGSLHPVVLTRPGRAPVRLEPFGAARQAVGLGAAHEFITAGSFEVTLEVGRSVSSIECELVGYQAHDASPVGGSQTVNIVDGLCSGITWLEFRVLDAMTADIRSGRSAAPLTHLRVQRAIGLESKRQVVAATERLVRRFRETGLIPPDTPSDHQRQLMCERTVELGLLAVLSRHHGTATALGD